MNPVTNIPPIPSDTLPRAGFWRRLAAAALDLIVVGMLTAWLPLAHTFPLMVAAYCAGMWHFKGTTVGGVICGIRLVRLDQGELSWGVTIMRAMAGFISLAALGLGFIWAGGRERRAWHDLIAGTTMVRGDARLALV